MVEENKIPEDKYNLVKILFFLFGLGGWIAWNASITGIDYFNSRLNPEYNPSFVFGFVFTWPLFLGNVLLIYLADKISLKVKINVSFVIILIWSISMPFITEYLPKTTAWYLLLWNIFINGLANSFVQGGLFGFVSIFPPKYIAIMMTSQAFSAVLLNFAKIIWIVAVPPDNTKGAEDMNIFYDSLIYLTVGFVILVSWIIGFNLIYELEYAKYFISKSKLESSSGKILQAK